MTIIRLRGHHVRNIEFYLFKKDREGLRFTGNFDYKLNFAFLENEYYREFTHNMWRIHNYMIEENPYIELINTCDEICKPACPYLVKRSMKCKNSYNSERSEKHNDELKEIDNSCIENFGLNLGETAKFSRIFRRIVNKNYEAFGFEDFDSFIENIDMVLHPRLVDLYMKK